MTADDRSVLEADIRGFLAQHHVMSLATVFGGAAHAASVFYAIDGFSLAWTSDPDSRHSAALMGDPRVAATIALDYDDFRLIRGLQVHGRASRLEGEQARRARELLRERYPFLRALDHLPEALRAAAERAAYYRLDPESMTLIDNTRGFGDKRTLSFSPRGNSSASPVSGI